MQEEFQIQANLTLEQFLGYWREKTGNYLFYPERQVLTEIALYGRSFKQAKNVVRKQGTAFDEKTLADVYSLYVEFCKPQTLTVSVERPDFSKGAAYYYNSNSCLWDDDERYDATVEWMQDPRSYAILVRNALGTTIGRAWAWFNGKEKTAFNPYGLNDTMWKNIFTHMGLIHTPVICVVDSSLYMNDRRVFSNVCHDVVIVNWLENEYIFDVYSNMFVHTSDLVEAYVDKNVKYVTARTNAVYSCVYDFYIHNMFAKWIILPDNTTWAYVFKNDETYIHLDYHYCAP